MIVEGRMTEPKEETTTGGTKLLKFSVAHEYAVKRGDDRILQTEFVECSLWNLNNAVTMDGKMTSAEMLEKGKMIKVTGFPKVDAWIDKTNGEIRTKLQCNAEAVQIVI